MQGIRWGGGRRPGSCQQVPERYQSHLLGLFTLGSAAPPPLRSRLLAPSHSGQAQGTPPHCLKIGGMTFLKVAPATSHPMGSTRLSPWAPLLAPLEPPLPGRPPGFPLLPLTPARGLMRRPGSSGGTAYDKAIKHHAPRLRDKEGWPSRQGGWMDKWIRTNSELLMITEHLLCARPHRGPHSHPTRGPLGKVGDGPPVA